MLPMRCAPGLEPLRRVPTGRRIACLRARGSVWLPSRECDRQCAFLRLTAVSLWVDRELLMGGGLPGCAAVAYGEELGGSIVHYSVGMRFPNASSHVVVDADDALAAALKAKADCPEAMITYVRRQNRRGDKRHPAKRLTGDSRLLTN